jgi:hypothetical protein
LNNDNRIHVRINPELTPVRAEQVELNAQIDVAVAARLTPLGTAGVATITLGILAMGVGLVMFLLAYPDAWYARNGVSYEASRRTIERIVLMLAGGTIALFLGSSMFFYGRTVLGKGTFDQFQTHEQVESAGVPEVR